MKKVLFTASFGFVGGEHTEVFEFDDDATDEKMHAEWWQWACQFVDGGPEVVTDEQAREYE